MSKKKDSFKPWLRRPAVNRSVTIPVTGPLTQPLTGFGGTFDPLALNPYAFFDGESYKGTLENPTLDLDPSNPDSLDVITATRAGSTATYTDSSGIIQVASPDTVRVDYVQGEQLTPTKFQLVPHTDFSTAHWAHLNGTVVTTDTTLSPDGATAKKFSAGNGVSSSSVRSIISTPTTSNTYTLSWYAKAGGFDESMVRIDAGGSTIKGSVNLLTGAVTLQTGSALDSISSEAVSGGWFRISMTMSLSGAGGSIMSRFYPTYSNGYIGDGSSGVYMAQPQLEEGTTATSFVANTTGSPKFISSAVYSDRVAMVLIEPSATNLITYSEDFSQGSWNKNRVTVVDNSITSPDGSLNAAKLVETATTATHRTWTQATTTAATHSFSVFAKAGERKRIGLRDNQIGNSAVFDLESGSVISGSGGSIAQAANGFFRITLTGTYAAAGTRHEIYVLPDNATTANASYTGDGTSGVYIWGAQLETGDLTSYIPTSGAAASRTTFSDFYNQSEGTFYVESVPNENTSGSFLFDLSFGNASTERLAIYNSGSNQKIFLRTSGTTWSDNIIGNRPAGGVLSRVAISCKTNNIEASIDGANMTPDTSATMSTTINKMTIGNRYENPNYLNGRIRRLIFWPYSSDRL